MGLEMNRHKAKQKPEAYQEMKHASKGKDWQDATQSHYIRDKDPSFF